MNRVLLILLLLIQVGVAAAQTYSTHNDNTGLWTNGSTWDQNWGGISIPNPLPAARTNIYGYVTAGTLSSPVNMNLPSSGGAVLNVYDTLRIHGNLSVANDVAVINVEPGGILILHGSYTQNNLARLTNKGTVVVMGDFSITGHGSNPSASSGNLYVGGNVSTGANSLNPKPLSALATDAPATNTFAFSSVISSQCTGDNTGTLTFSGFNATVVRWESSIDYFSSDVQPIANTSTQYTYHNLLRTTTFRVYYRRNDGSFYYSNSATIIISEPPIGGEISGPNLFCGSASSVALALSNYSGTVKAWEWSTNNFATIQQSLTTTSETLTLTNLTTTTQVRAVVSGCKDVYSNVFTITINPASNGGTIVGPTAVCRDSNSGVLNLQGRVGNVLRWEVSGDGFVADIRSLINTSDTQSFTNLSAATWYRAVVQNSTCAIASSPAFKIDVTEVLPGTLTGTERVCAGANTGTLQLQNHSGTIKRWEWSNDGFKNHLQSIASTQAQHSFTNITADTWFRAIVGNAECGDKPSAVHVVRLDQLSVGGSVSGTSSVCKGINSGTLTLSGYNGKIMRWEYSTDGFASHIQPVANTSTIHTFSNISSNRWYRAVVQNGSCALAYSALHKITVNELAGGTLSGPAVVCQGSNNGQLALQGQIGNVVRWESSSDGFAANVQAISHTNATYTFTNLGSDTWFRVVIGNSDCGEVFSTTLHVQTEQPSIGGSIAGTASFCSPINSGTLQLENQQGLILRWESSTDNFSSDIQTISHTASTYAYSNLAQTTSYRAVVQNGSCTAAYSATVTISILPPSAAGAVTGAAAVCYGEHEGTLVLESMVGQVVRWESSTDGFATVTEIANTGNSLNYQNLTLTTSYRAVVQNNNCTVAYSQGATITIKPVTQAGRVEGGLAVVGGSNSGTLQLTGYEGRIIHWEASTDGFTDHIAQINNSTDLQTFQDLTQTTWYRAVVQGMECGPVYAEPAKVVVNHAPVANQDMFLVEITNFTAPVSVILNDTDPDGDLLKAVPVQLQTAAGGSAEINEQGILIYQPTANFLGIDSLRYTVCDGVSGATLCSEALVVLDVRLPPPALIVYQGVSPNGDNSNEYWRIEHIERYPENVVQLYDRFGALVFEQQGYNNEGKKFIGLGNKGLRPGGNTLPEGTYFYKIKTAAKAPILQGYIVLKN